MHPEARRLLAAAQADDVQTEDLLDYCRQALSYTSDAREVFRVAIRGMRSHNQLRNCEELVHQALQRYPSDPEILEAYALWREYQGDYDIAAMYWRRLDNVAPTVDPQHIRLARALLYANDLAGAAHILGGTLAQYGHSREPFLPQVHALFGETLLKAGDPAGFAHYVHRISANAGFYDIPDIPWWNGEPLAGKSILATHHLGYGDQLLLSSVIPLLEAHGVKVSVTLDNAVASLVHHGSPNTNIQIADRSCTPYQAPDLNVSTFAQRMKPDFQTTILHLPLLAMAVAGKDCEIFRPYLSAPEQAKAYVAPVMNAIRQVAAGRQLVGIAWDCIQRNFAGEQGEYVASFSSRRSIPTAQIAALIDDPDVRARYHFVSLHPHTHFEHIREPLPSNLSQLGTTIGYFTDTAAIIDRCDSVLSIDMSMANLACLMHKETTLMLQHEGEWRFGIAGARAPWLRTPHCLRQVIPGQWNTVLDEARERLLGVASARVPALSMV